jgi:molybdopterin synthase catalytic subunit
VPVAYSEVTESPLDPNKLRAMVSAPDCGAVFVFEGTVRDHDGGRQVQSLQYEAHPTAAGFISDLAQRIAREHPDVTVAVAHRHGELRIGDVAFCAAAASAHRAESLAALAALVETVKAELPIWKRQVFVDGSIEWVNCA